MCIDENFTMRALCTLRASVTRARFESLKFSATTLASTLSPTPLPEPRTSYLYMYREVQIQGSNWSFTTMRRGGACVEVQQLTESLQANLGTVECITACGTEERVKA